MKMIHLFQNISRWLVALLCVVVAVFPLWYTFSVVFSPPGTPVTQQLYPSSFSAGIEKISAVLTETNLNILKASMVTFLFAAFQVVGMVIVTSLAAYEFALFDFPGKNFLFILALSSLMMPTVVTLIPLFQVAIKLKWLNTLQGLAIPGMASALALFIFRQFMESLSRELVDAGRVDGASHFGIYRLIILPLCQNAILTVTVWAFVNAWANYIWPLVIITKPDMFTVSLVAAAQVGQRSWTTVDFAMATYLISAIPPIILYVFLQRYIIQGFSTTGLKG
ncbi:MAG: carbohydrate ABC transporter permease [Anaerolineaceae bacterium]|nr:carbohydrate ABC transporter permease [Anaerolineaceae bacterium]